MNTATLNLHGVASISPLRAATNLGDNWVRNIRVTLDDGNVFTLVLFSDYESGLDLKEPEPVEKEEPE